jgi:hypothetical protein
MDGIQHIDESEALLLVFFYLSFIVVPLLGLVSIGGLVGCIVDRKKPGGLLASTIAATIAIPLSWVVIIRARLFDTPLLALGAILAVTVTIGLVGQQASRTGPTSRSRIRTLMASQKNANNNAAGKHRP